MSERSLLSFPVLIGRQQPELADIPSFMSHGVPQLLANMITQDSQNKQLLQDLTEIVICRPADPSLLGVFNGVAADYKHRARIAGDGTGAQIGHTILAVNSLPKATLGWKTPFEAATELLGGKPSVPLAALRASLNRQ